MTSLIHPHTKFPSFSDHFKLLYIRPSPQKPQNRHRRSDSPKTQNRYRALTLKNLELPPPLFMKNSESSPPLTPKNSKPSSLPQPPPPKKMPKSLSPLKNHLCTINGKPSISIPRKPNNLTADSTTKSIIRVKLHFGTYRLLLL